MQLFYKKHQLYCPDKPQRYYKTKLNVDFRGYLKLKETIKDDILSRWEQVRKEAREKRDVQYYILIEDIGVFYGLCEFDKYFNNRKKITPIYDLFELKQSWLCKALEIENNACSYSDAEKYYIKCLKENERIFTLDILKRIFNFDAINYFYTKYDRITDKIGSWLDKAILEGHEGWLQEYLEESYTCDFFKLSFNNATNDIKHNTMMWDTSDNEYSRSITEPQAINYRKRNGIWKTDFTNTAWLLPDALFFEHTEERKTLSEETVNAIRTQMKCDVGDIIAYFNFERYLRNVWWLFKGFRYIEDKFYGRDGRQCLWT